MGRMLFLLTPLLGVVFCSHGKLSGPELVVRVSPGDNITLHCDCQRSSGKFIAWFRNCSHENQPSLILRTNYKYDPSYLEDKVNILNPFPRLHLVENQSSDSYDLLIMNTTDSDEGLYYCGTEQKEVDTTFSQKYIYKYGNITTRILLNSTDSSPCPGSTGSSVVFWMMVFTPTFSILASFVSFILVYQLCQKTGKGHQQKRPDNRRQRRQNRDEDLYLAQAVYWVQRGRMHQTDSRWREPVHFVSKEYM
ncbi:uncharacterized protein LOC116326013 isoform X1 [Oreochromis aureus]|uniref:uncharacterized protein LOC116326013 isoform X1 n=1 Tax=Oreochromis aureus TaxID=47969 RepID=UPI00195438C9|nr:uncharacterized protein LOC116326013 isoform X1 [Oreochromis aureus]XP_039469145.1 uncharacterized protein LOC116326013 isoform X1 [Oreochromis aureus]XP_039469146.1 uncharacterized protein LOC116326013 isoform X1 [Oreochromis aureus]